MRADDIGLDKCARAHDRSVNVRLGREMHNRVDLLVAQQGLNRLLVDDIAFDESILFVPRDGLETAEIAGIGQRIENDEAIFRILVHPVMHEVSADKTGAAGDE